MKTTPKRKVGLIVLGLLVSGLLVFGGLAWLFLRPSPAPPPVLLRPTAPQAAETRKHLDVLGKAISQPGTGPRTLRLSEKDINIALAASPTVKKLLAAHGVKAVQVVLQEPDDIVVRVAVAVQGHVQNIQISGAVAPDPKLGARFTATQAQVGRLPLPPAFVTAQANGLAARFSHQLLRHFSLSAQSICVEKKDLVIVGVPRHPASLHSAAPKAAFPQSVSPARR